MLKKLLSGSLCILYVATLFATAMFFSVEPTGAAPEFAYYYYTTYEMYMRGTGELCVTWEKTTVWTGSTDSHLRGHSTRQGDAFDHDPYTLGEEYKTIVTYPDRC